MTITEEPKMPSTSLILKLDFEILKDFSKIFRNVILKNDTLTASAVLLCPIKTKW
jgi:hypothetical protein